MRRKQRAHRDLPTPILQILPGLLALAAAVVLWQLISLFFPPVFLPGPGALLQRMVAIYSDPASYAVIARTLARIFESFLISMLIGMALGLLMGLRRSIEIFFDSWIMVLLTFPAVCWAFLTVLWFGISQAAPIVTVVLIVFPFVAMNIWAGTKAVEKDLISMARVYKADRRLMLRKVLVPQLMPYVFSSLRIALSLSWKIALVAEAFGAGTGVGQQLFYWFQETRVDMMLAWGVSFMLVMVLIDLLVLRTWARRTFAWRPQVAT
ncbi:MAG TPA: ABC transporter permease [Xanthobacteraceae bacterium]|jgi:NitT/TauT family transport system permease protein